MSKLLTVCMVVVACVGSLGMGKHEPASGHPESSPVRAYLETLEAVNRYGAEFAFLSEWRLSELLELLTWLNRGLCFSGDWTSEGLKTALRGLRMTLAALGGDGNRLAALLGLSGHRPFVYRICATCYPNDSHVAAPARNQITFNSNPDLTSFLHEMGHLVDYYLAQALETESTWWSEAGLVGLGWFREAHQPGEANLPAPWLETSQPQAPHNVGDHPVNLITFRQLRT